MTARGPPAPAATPPPPEGAGVFGVSVFAKIDRSKAQGLVSWESLPKVFWNNRGEEVSG